MVEIDVRLLADDTLVLFHDAEVSGKAISALSFDEVQSLTPSIHVPTLGDACRACPQGSALLLDFKDASTRLVDLVVREIERLASLSLSFTLQSDQLEILEQFSHLLAAPNLMYLSSLNRGVRPPDELADRLVDNGVYGITAKRRSWVDSEYVSAFRERGVAYFVWTVNARKEMAHYRRLGVDGIISDRPDVLLRELYGD